MQILATIGSIFGAIQQLILIPRFCCCSRHFPLPANFNRSLCGGWKLLNISAQVNTRPVLASVEGVLAPLQVGILF